MSQTTINEVLLSPLTSNRVSITDGAGHLTQSIVTAVEVAHINGVTQDIQPTLNSIQSTANSSNFASGTKLLFFQALPPAGWTQVVTHNDKALRVVNTAGGGSGGSSSFSSGLNLSHAHNITVPSAGSHSHTVNSHSHTISHQHVLPLGINGAQIFFPATSGPSSWSPGGVTRSYSYWVQGVAGIGAATPLFYFLSDDSDTGSSGSSSPGTDAQGSHTHAATNDSQLSTYTFLYVDVIIASKN
jgi:hypothetical protein